MASNLSTPYTMQDWFDNASNYGPNKKKSEFEFQILWKLACVIKFRWHWWNFSIVIDSACLENDPLSISNMAFCGHPPRDMVGYDKVIKSRQNQTHLQFSINFSSTAAAELCICIGYISTKSAAFANLIVWSWQKAMAQLQSYLHNKGKIRAGEVSAPPHNYLGRVGTSWSLVIFSSAATL